MTSSASSVAGRVLVVKLSSLGDVLHAVPAVRRIAEALGRPVDWVTQPEYADLVRSVPGVSEVIPFPRRGWVRGWAAFSSVLRAREFDLVIDFQGLLKSAWVARIARARRVVGVARRREGTRWLIPDAPPLRTGTRHAVEGLLDVVEHLGLDRGPVRFDLRFPQPALGPGPHVGLVPFSRWPAKNWPVEKFAEAARRIRGSTGATLHVFGSFADTASARALMDAAGDGVVGHAGQTPLPVLGGWLSAMDTVLTVDSGPMHLAVAVGIPVVALFGPTDPARTGPYGERHVVLTPPGAEGPRHRYKSPSNDLIARIPVEAAVQAVEKMIGTPVRAPAP